MAALILIVEDDELLREMYATKFIIEGYETATAGDGKEGLEKALTLNPELVILDNLMPFMTGLEVLEAYNTQADEATRAQIVVLSNKSSLEDINEAKRLGAVDYLIKSQHTPEDIVARVKQLLG